MGLVRRRNSSVSCRMRLVPNRHSKSAFNRSRRSYLADKVRKPRVTVYLSVPEV